MKNLKRNNLLFLLLATLLITHVQAHPKMEEFIKRLSDWDDQYHVEIRQKHQALIKDLIEIVADDKYATLARTRAVDLLGDLRASEATDTLVVHIVEIPSIVAVNLDVGERYPCARALIKIGKPSSIAALNELRKPISDLRRYTHSESVYTDGG